MSKASPPSARLTHGPLARHARRRAAARARTAALGAQLVAVLGGGDNGGRNVESQKAQVMETGLKQGSLKDTVCPFGTWLLPPK